MQKVIIIGRAGKDATVQQLPNTQVINFSICHSEKWKDKAGVQHEKSQWWDCSWFTDKVTISQYIKRGSELYVEGVADVRLYTNQKNETLPQLTLKVISVQLLGSPSNERSVSTEMSGHYSEQPLRQSTGEGTISNDRLNF